MNQPKVQYPSGSAITDESKTTTWPHTQDDTSETQVSISKL